MPQTTLTFVGTDSCVPRGDNDTASFILNDHILVDCGWNAAINMSRFGYTPLDLDWVLITHCHQDHYLGLAGVLFYIHLRERDKVLKIGGPAEEIERIVAQAKAYVGWEKPDVEVMGLTPDAQFAVGEFTLVTARTQHEVPGLAYRFQDERTGAEIGISGDTGYLPALAEHFHKVDLLVYEAALGVEDPPPDAGHSSVYQSATIARDAGAGRLYLAHTPPSDKTGILAAGREIFPQTYWPDPGERVVI